MEKSMLMDMIGRGETAQALEALLKFLPQEDKDYGKFILLKGQWSTVQDHIHLGIADKESTKIELNRISNATLEFIKNFSVSTLHTPIELDNNIKTRDKIMQIVDENTEKYKYDLFFSFSYQDTNEARKICDQLRGYGLRIFFSADEMRLKGGHQFSEVIDEALENSLHFLLYCTPNAMRSKWVSIEYTTFHDQLHIKNSNVRRFLIFEGHDFSDKLLRITYRNNQRVTNVDDILNVLLPDTLKNSYLHNKTPIVLDSKKLQKTYLFTGISLVVLLSIAFLIIYYFKGFQNKQEAYENTPSIIEYKQLITKGDSLLENGQSKLELKKAKSIYEQAIKTIDTYHHNARLEKDIKLISKVSAAKGIIKCDSLINAFEQPQTPSNEEPDTTRARSALENLRKKTPTEQLIKDALLSFKYEKSTNEANMLEAKRIMNHLGINQFESVGPSFIRGNFGSGQHMTIWVKTYAKVNTYGVRIGENDETYFEIDRRK